MKNYFSIVSLIALMAWMVLPATGQISITATGASYSENFNGMGPLDSNYIPGWFS